MENACMHDTGEFLMKIIKIVNNNIVTSLDEQNREIIVMGRGLGFGRKPGMPIEDEKVEKVFRLNSAGENQKLVDIIRSNFDLRPAGIIKMLDLRRPIYKQTAAYGHFGRTDVDLPWEHLDKVEDLKKYLA